jgi:hypothetical protein
MGRGDPASVLADALARSDRCWEAVERLTAEVEPKPGCAKAERSVRWDRPASDPAVVKSGWSAVKPVPSRQFARPCRSAAFDRAAPNSMKAITNGSLGAARRRCGCCTLVHHPSDLTRKRQLTD